MRRKSTAASGNRTLRSTSANRGSLSKRPLPTQSRGRPRKDRLAKPLTLSSSTVSDTECNSQSKDEGYKPSEEAGDRTNEDGHEAEIEPVTMMMGRVKTNMLQVMDLLNIFVSLNTNVDEQVSGVVCNAIKEIMKIVDALDSAEYHEHNSQV